MRRSQTSWSTRAVPAACGRRPSRASCRAGSDRSPAAACPRGHFLDVAGQHVVLLEARDDLLAGQSFRDRSPSAPPCRRSGLDRRRAGSRAWNWYSPAFTGSQRAFSPKRRHEERRMRRSRPRAKKLVDDANAEVAADVDDLVGGERTGALNSACPESRRHQATIASIRKTGSPLARSQRPAPAGAGACPRSGEGGAGDAAPPGVLGSSARRDETNVSSILNGSSRVNRRQRTSWAGTLRTRPG